MNQHSKPDPESPIRIYFAEIPMPQAVNGFTRLPNSILEALGQFRLSGELWQVLCVIFRKTYGWNKNSDRISLSQFASITGLMKPNILRALKKLESQNMILINRNENGTENIYSFNTNFSSWRSLSKLIPVIKTDNKSLSKMIPTKDNINTIPPIVPQKRGTPSPETPFEKIVDVYHEALPTLPRCLKLTATRKRQIKGRWMGSRQAQCLEWWRSFFEGVAGMPFYLGKNDRGWQADLQWITKEENFIKLLEKLNG